MSDLTERTLRGLIDEIKQAIDTACEVIDRPAPALSEVFTGVDAGTGEQFLLTIYRDIDGTVTRTIATRSRADTVIRWGVPVALEVAP